MCITPVNVRGWAESIELSGTLDDQQVAPNGTPVPGQCGPGRLLAVNNFVDSGDPERAGGVFDLNRPVPVGGNTALECEEYRRTTWERFSIEMTYVDVTVDLNDGRYTIRHVFEANPLTEEPVFNEPSCTLDPPYVESQRFLPEPIRVQRGDVLVCAHASPEAECADTDFRFLDLDAMELSESRPARSLRNEYIEKLRVGRDENGNFQDVFCNVDCARSSSYCGWAAGGYGVSFRLASDDAFRLYSEIVFSTDPRHPFFQSDEPSPDGEDDEEKEPIDPANLEPVTLYTYIGGDGTAVEALAKDLEVVLRLDTSDFLFIEGVESGELDSMTDLEIVSRLALRDQWSRVDPHNFGHQPLHRGKLGILV
nr:MAG: hypothetical protein DIU78_06315 [Pseudomonadota bacterium]